MKLDSLARDQRSIALLDSSPLKLGMIASFPIQYSPVTVFDEMKRNGGLPSDGRSGASRDESADGRRIECS